MFLFFKDSMIPPQFVNTSNNINLLKDLFLINLPIQAIRLSITTVHCCVMSEDLGLNVI